MPHRWSAAWQVVVCCTVLCYAMQVFCSKIGLAPYIEVALHHKKAKVLMVTDAVVCIPEDPPEARHP